VPRDSGDDELRRALSGLEVRSVTNTG
jgi:hypothetical protein